MNMSDLKIVKPEVALAPCLVTILDYEKLQFRFSSKAHAWVGSVAGSIIELFVIDTCIK